jgi:hypothetical protein
VIIVDIKRILIELLIVIFGLVIGLINLSYPFGIREIATIILLIGMGILGAIIYISDKNKKNLELIKPIFLSRLNTDIDYDRQGDCTLCIPLIPFTKADNINSCLKKDLEFINEEIESYNNLAKAFVCDFNSEIISLVKLELPTEHDDIVLLSKPLKYHTKHLYYQIGKHLSSFEDGKPQILHFNTRPTLEADGITRWKADIVNVLFGKCR